MLKDVRNARMPDLDSECLRMPYECLLEATRMPPRKHEKQCYQYGSHAHIFVVLVSLGLHTELQELGEVSGLATQPRGSGKGW